MGGLGVGDRLRGVVPVQDGLLGQSDHPVILGPEDSGGQESPQVLGGHVQRDQPNLQTPGCQGSLDILLGLQTLLLIVKLL